MIDATASGLRSAAGDDEIHKSLTAELYGSLGAALPAYAAAICVACAGCLSEGRPRDAICLVAIVITTAVRIGVLIAYRRRPAAERTVAEMKWWEFAYGSLAGLWTLLLGVDASFLVMSNSTILQIFATTMAIGMTGGIAARHAPHPWIVVVQMIAILCPYTAALVFRYGIGASGLICMTFFMFYGVLSATRQINANLVSAMRNSVANRTLKDRLDTALNNMTHGLIMFDAEHKLQVVNARFAALFCVERAMLVPGLSLVDVVDLCIANFPRRNRSREEWIGIFEDVLRARARRNLTLDLYDGRVIDFRCEPIDHGGTVLLLEDLTEKYQAAAQIARLAHYDVLTDLPNRSNFLNYIPTAIEKAKTSLERFSVFYLDLDRFKEVNDSLGHLFGDALLKQVADRLSKCIGRGDLCYRLGGDEFVVIHFAPDGHDEELAERLISSISKPFQIEENTVRIGLSVGIARFGEDGGDGAELLKNADIALYKAKDAGKQTYRRFCTDMGTEVIDRRAREADLRDALERGAIDVYFQPIVDIATNEIVACEALLRWFHPSRGLMPTDETIRLAESTGLIIDLGAIVLQKACAEAMTWPREITVAVNLSALQFRQGVVVQQIEQALAISGLPGHRLEVEITESLAINNIASDRAAIEEIRALGVRVALDDFGTGYTSLSYLGQIPFDGVKIDRSFVTRIGSDAMADALIRLMAGLLKGLGKTMVVEGIETQAQVAVLRDLGAQLMQGYFFARPQTADETRIGLSRDVLPRLRVVA